MWFLHAGFYCSKTSARRGGEGEGEGEEEEEGEGDSLSFPSEGSISPFEIPNLDYVITLTLKASDHSVHYLKLQQLCKEIISGLPDDFANLFLDCVTIFHGYYISTRVK